jgi:hypothetical protein
MANDIRRVLTNLMLIWYMCMSKEFLFVAHTNISVEDIGHYYRAATGSHSNVRPRSLWPSLLHMAHPSPLACHPCSSSAAGRLHGRIFPHRVPPSVALSKLLKTFTYLSSIRSSVPTRGFIWEQQCAFLRKVVCDHGQCRRLERVKIHL